MVALARAERASLERSPCAAQLLSEAAESNETTLFFCKIGKDRTGLLAAMVLSCCGASDDEIVSDYMRCACRPRLPICNPQLRGLRVPSPLHPLSSFGSCPEQHPLAVRASRIS